MACAKAVGKNIETFTFPATAIESGIVSLVSMISARVSVLVVSVGNAALNDEQAKASVRADAIHCLAATWVRGN
jgi:hypothetical protein